MKLNKGLLENSLENAKANFNKVCDRILEAFKKANQNIDNFQKELMGKKEEQGCKCKNCKCCQDNDGNEVQEAVEPEFNLEEVKEEENKDNE